MLENSAKFHGVVVSRYLYRLSRLYLYEFIFILIVNIATTLPQSRVIDPIMFSELCKCSINYSPEKHLQSVRYYRLVPQTMSTGDLLAFLKSEIASTQVSTDLPRLYFHCVGLLQSVQLPIRIICFFRTRLVQWRRQNSGIVLFHNKVLKTTES